MGDGAIDSERYPQHLGETSGARGRRRSSFDATGRSRFVGRRHELRALQAALDAARRGQGRTLLVAGEPGIGKSRLVAEVGERALAAGWRVVTGHCRVAEGAPALWVWIQISRALLAARAAANPGQEDISSDLANLLPREIAEPGAFRWESGIGTDASAERFRVMDALCRFLTTSADRTPLLLVLDDLHCADSSTLVLLGMLAAEAAHHSLAVVGAYRDVGPTPSGALAATINELVRRDPSCRFELRGLERRDVARFVGLTRRLEDSLLHSICATTTGNPLFVTEIVRWMDAGDSAWVDDGARRRLRVPPTVRDAISWRLGELGNVAAVLEAASVFGGEFSAGDVARIADRPSDRLDDYLAAAVRERLLVESAGRLRFAHALVRDVLYDRLPRDRRCRLHEAAGLALEASEDLRRFDVLEAIAWHVFRALPVGDSTRAVDWMCRAGDAAMECLAYEEAAEHFGRALSLLEVPAASPARRCDLLLRRGAALDRAGDLRGGREAFRAAADLARPLGFAERLAWAALGFFGVTAARAPYDRAACALLSEARRTVGDADLALHVRLLSAEAVCRYFTRDAGLRRQLSDAAVALARESGDAQMLAVALEGRLYSQMSPARARDSLQTAAEVVQLADQAGDEAASFRAGIISYANRLVCGDVAEAEHELWRLQRLAERLRLPRCRWQLGVVAAARALVRGDLEESQQHAAAAGRLGRGIDESTAEHYELLQRFYLTCFSGNAPGIEAIAAAALKRLDPGSPQATTYRVALCAALYWAGREGEARSLFRTIANHGPLDIADDVFLFFSLGLLAELCWRLGDAAQAERLHERLAQHRGQVGVVSWGAACEGSLAHHLALLAACCERWDEAEELFEEAAAVNERLGLPLLAARTRHRHGEVLRRAGRAPQRAEALLASATDTYRRCGARDPWVDASVVLDAAPRRAEALPRNLFARDGDVWTLVFADRVARLPHRRGLEQLAYLLRRPGVAVPAVELAGGTAPPPAIGRGGLLSSASLAAEGLRVGSPGGGGPMIDACAARSYRARLTELRSEADAAEVVNDLGRLDAVQTEIARLEEALAEALGRGGRLRLLGATAERARVAVRNNLVKALALIARDHPELHEHLALSLRTGTLCMYAPCLEVAWRFASAGPPLPPRK